MPAVPSSVDTPEDGTGVMPQMQIASLAGEKEMIAPLLENPPSPTSPEPGTNAIDFSRGAVTLLREVLRQIEGWQRSLYLGESRRVRKEMADVGCEIDEGYFNIMKRRIDEESNTLF